jgi:hypothetical protein
VLKKLNLADRWRKAIVERKKPVNQIDKKEKVEKKPRKSAKKSSDQAIIKKDVKLDGKDNEKKNLADKKVKKAKKDKITTKKEEDSNTIKEQSSKRKTKSKTK